MSAQRNQKVNLLPSANRSENTSSRILQWILTSFRVIVIGTELIVIGAFLSRFALDARGNDLSDDIEAKKAVISAYSDFEKTFKQTQLKIGIVETAINQNTTSRTLEAIASSTPSDVQLTNITKSEKSVTIKGLSFSELSIAQLSANLNNSGSFQTIAVVDINTKQSNPFITFEIKGEEK